MGLIFFLSSQPSLPSIPELDKISWGDKIEHFAFYGVLGALIWWAIDARRAKWQRIVLTVVLAAAYGMSDEFHQRFVPNRSCDVCDLVADTLGALCAAIVIWRGGVILGRRKAGRESIRGQR